MLRILVATGDGLLTLDQQGHEAAKQHAGRSVTAVVRDGRQLWAILDRTQVWYSPEGEWRHVASLEGVAAEGRGTYDGGRGIRREYLILRGPEVATYYAEQTNERFRPSGAAGGGDGAPSRVTVLDPDGGRLDLPPKGTVEVSVGTTVRFETSGGGGFGPSSGSGRSGKR